jgi:hypothetical protein
MKNHLIIWLLLVLSLQGCVPGETPIPVHDPGDVNTVSIDMGVDYTWLVYFDLKTNTIVERKMKPSWDLGFEASPEGYHVILNSSRIMAAYNTGKTDFSTVTIDDTLGKEQRDSPTGSLDSTAFGDWRNGNPVYLVNRGNDGTNLGWAMVQILSVDEQQYTVRFSALDGSNEQTVTVPKDDNYNFTFLSLTTGATVSVEPPKRDWDVVFTSFMHLYYHLGRLPYMVTGCLLNRYNTAAAVDTVNEFSAISFDNIANYSFSTDINTIGFDWKTYSFNAGTYMADPSKNYIVRDSEGLYYKLHFIDFMSTSGEKGHPKWEYQQL